jgi:hypothetical protein
MGRVSLIDPDARDRDPARAARRRLAWMMFMVVAAAAGGYGASIFGDFPGSSYSFGGDEVGALLKCAVLLVGCAATIISMGVLLRLPKVAGVRGQPTFVVALALLAAAAGMFAGTLLPTSIKRFAGWDLSSARLYVRVQSGVLVLGALLLIVWAVRAVRSGQLRAALRATGHRTTAVVTEVHDSGHTINNSPRIRVTMRFTDADGKERFVRRWMTVSRLAIPDKGDRVPVWFDPKDPGQRAPHRHRRRHLTAGLTGP